MARMSDEALQAMCETGQAQLMAMEYLQAEAHDDARIRRGFRLAYGREPGAQERTFAGRVVAILHPWRYEKRPLL